jgi:uncharacterized protein (DUF433 family)
MVVLTKNTLGIGLYTPEEAAFYARVRTDTINRWMFGNARGGRVIEPQVSADGDKVVTFLDFIQALAIRAIRTKHKVPLEKIRQAVDLARDKFGIPYPFAVEHTTYLFSDKQDQGHGDIILKIKDQLVVASGQDQCNLVMNEIAELYMRDLVYDRATGLASRYTAWASPSGGQIVMDPRRRFGEPIVESCGYTAETLWEAYEIEGGVKPAAEAHGVSEREIELALEYHDFFLNSSAA